MNKQIEEMAKDICHAPDCELKKANKPCYKYCKAYIYAFRAINAGYRKQIVGEWEQQPRPYEDEIVCSVCGANFNIIDNCTEKFDFCPNCGARMKGGETDA